MIGELVLIVALSVIAALAWFPCCCGEVEDPPPCSTCSADAGTVTVTISGAADDKCNQCNEMLNGSFILSRQYTNACLWKNVNYGHACYSSGGSFIGGILNLQLSAQQLYPSTSKGWSLGISFQVLWYPNSYYDSAVYRWSSGGSSAFDCTANRSLTNHSYTPDPVQSTCANFGSLTINVN